MKKKVYALILAAMLALSAAACNNNSESSSSAPAPAASSAQASDEASASTDESKDEASKAESSEEASKTDESKAETSTETSTDTSTEASADTSTETSTDGQAGTLGPKTTAAFAKLNGDACTLDMDITADGESSDSGMSVSASSMKVIKKGESSRTIMDMGVMSVDILVTPEGAYMLNAASKTAYSMPADDDSMTSGMDISSLTESLTDGSISYTGDGEEEFEGATYSYEAYSSVDGSTMKFYFEGDDVRYMVSESAGVKSTAKINEISAEADESLLVLPSDYTVTDISSMFGDVSLVTDDEGEADAEGEGE